MKNNTQQQTQAAFAKVHFHFLSEINAFLIVVTLDVVPLCGFSQLFLP